LVITIRGEGVVRVSKEIRNKLDENSNPEDTSIEINPSLG
jgi:hypothetical protein